MARKNSLKKRKEYNSYLVQSEQDRIKEKEEKLEKLRKVNILSFSYHNCYHFSDLFVLVA